MRTLITHENFHVPDRVFNTADISASRVHTGIIQDTPQPASCGGIHVWIDGELYNQPYLRETMGIPSIGTDAALLRDLYVCDESLSFLKDIDGIYSAVIFDSKHKLLHLVTDRYGLRHIYWHQNNQGLGWSSEVKAFLALPEFVPHINPESIEDFFSVGYLLGNKTWFSGVKLLPSGSVLTFKIQTQEVCIFKYWGWNQIKPLPPKVDKQEIVEELGRLFISAVETHSRSRLPVGVSLSGGLDSRALLAAMPEPEKGERTHAVTFGKADCDDVRIATEVAKIKQAIHHFVELTSHNWLGGRIQGVWRTDGQNDLLHMHTLVSLEEQRRNYSINLNGFLGDALLGGSYIGDPRWTAEEKADERGRRFINEGTRLTNNFIHNRLPFFTNPLMEFTCSIPESLRGHSRIYNRFLLQRFPHFFRRIPWQTTGSSISSSQSLIWVRRKVRGARRRLSRAVARFGGNWPTPYELADYASWIRQEPARPVFETILLDSSALYQEFLTTLDVKRLWDEHMQGIDRTQELCRVLTFELWLQQVFEGRYRNEDPDIHLQSTGSSSTTREIIPAPSARNPSYARK